MPNCPQCSQATSSSAGDLARIVHASAAPTVDMTVLPGVLDALNPAAYCSSTPRIQASAVARWNGHLQGLATQIHKQSGLALVVHASAAPTASGFQISDFRFQIEGCLIADWLFVICY